MPKPKERKEQTKGASLPIVPILQKFLRTYEKHCARFQASVSPAIRRDLQGSIEGFTLIKPDDFSPSARPISLEPLLTAIQDEHYMLGKKICIWGLQLSNAEIARLASLLELRGKLTCPFATVEIIDCKMDLWSLGRLGKALQFSSLRSLVLDYCKFGNEEIERLFSGLEKSQRLQVLSLCYCGLGPWCGSRLGVVISQCAICELRLDGNYLQCSGALALLRPMAEYAELQGSHPPPRASPHNGNPPQVQRESSTLSPVEKLSEAIRVKTTLGKKKKKKGIKKKAQGLVEAGPWLVKLHLADNGIDGKGEEDHLLEFTQILTCSVIKYSAHLQEIDLGNNALGEKAAAGILAALRARRTGKLPVLKVTVTPRISSDTFRSIWKHSNSSRINHKKKKKVSS
uniref:Predicted gene 28729 n=1 Tax=Jaculus jaculus TaxID=51337 RepID=A0A8C5P5C6_JACJA